MQLYAPPEFVKSAGHESKHGEPHKLPATAYAGEGRTFPVHTKAATWLSAAFLTHNMEKSASPEFQSTKSKVMQAARLWGIDSIVEGMFLSKAAAAAPAVGIAHALVYTEDGLTKKAFPMRNAQEVLAASEVFTKFHEKLSFDVKHDMAKRILEKMVEYGAMVKDIDHLNKCAGYGFTSAAHIAEAWRQRAVLLRDSNPTVSKQAEAVAESVLASSVDARDTGARVKMAELMDVVDKQNKLTGFYSTDIDRPEDVMFGINYKVAAEVESSSVRLVTGETFDKSAMDGVSTDMVETWMGTELADACKDDISDELDIEKLAAVAATLPRADAVTFRNMLQSAGVQPAAVVKKAFSILSATEVAELAAQYDQGR